MVFNPDGRMMRIMEEIKENALRLNVGIGDVVPVNRLIDIPMAVRRLGERPDIDSIVIAVDFPELKLEHERALVERIRFEASSIGKEMDKPVSMELMNAEIGEFGREKIKNLLEGMMERSGQKP